MEMGFLFFGIRVEKPKIHVSEHFSLYSENLLKLQKY